MVKPTFDDMQKLSERAFVLELEEIPGFVREVIEKFELEGIQKCNLAVITSIALLKNFVEGKLFDMSESEFEQTKWLLLKSLFPDLGDGPISIMKWNTLLVPSGESYFKSISPEAFETIQQSARLLLDMHNSGSRTYEPEQIKHWENIINGEVPFGYTIIKPDEDQTKEV